MFKDFLKSKYRSIAFQIWKSVVSSVYWTVTAYLSWWPLNVFPFRPRKTEHRRRRVAYFTWQYPVLSQTFIQREVGALRKGETCVYVISDVPNGKEATSGVLLSSSELDCTLEPLDKNKLRQYRLHFLLRRPLRYLNLFLFVILHKYHYLKTFAFDRKVFGKAIYLAGVAKEKRIDHIHAPWADNCAFIALVASRLLGVTYSVQGRAHDIHRRTYLLGLSEKLNNAEFIITNSRYNGHYLASIDGFQNKDGIHVIYNGINLEEFKPDVKRRGVLAETRILSVARLIEQKGLIYLLEACRLLRDSGYSFSCTIVGGTEDLFMNYYIDLKRAYNRWKLEECVEFLGPQPFTRVMEMYKNADIFVLPCVIAEDGSRDITPNSLIEAMAMELPVISTSVTAIPEIVESGVEGLLIPEENSQALLEAMIKLIKREDLRLTFGANARKKIEARFNVHKNIRKYVRLFDGQAGIVGI